MKITSKGQVTIPEDLRKAAGFFPHTEVEFKRRGEGLYLTKKRGRRNRGRMIVEALRGKGDVQVTTEEVMTLFRGD